MIFGIFNIINYFGEGGIRTHVGVKLPIRFRVGAVMTASVPLLRGIILVKTVLATGYIPGGTMLTCLADSG